MTRFILLFIFFVFMFAQSVFAQQQEAWIQLESHPSLATAQDAARGYAAQIPDVNGFSLGAGWYAVALGPYSPIEAQGVLNGLRRQGLIPRDAYLATSEAYRQQFWPVGATALNQTGTAAQTETGDITVTALEGDAAADPETQPLPEAEVTTTEPEPEPEPIEETRRQAIVSERQLTRNERAALQVALQWAGFYSGRIDAAFGPGTRGAMAGWQRNNGYGETGVLTTRQRAELLRQYNAVLEGLGLRTVRDAGAGIEMKLPMNVVKFDRYEAPFAHYSATGDIDALVLLISQKGDRSTLVGLYDIMQTLEIVPEDGKRAIEGDAFTLIGENDRIVSHTQAWLKNGEVKGFSLIWPAGDEDRRTRLLDAMQESFQRIEGVLDPAAGADTQQRIDLVAGLEIRRPKLSRSGFYVDRTGNVVTTTEVVQGCEKITIDEDYRAEIAARNDSLGIAVLRPIDPLAPIAVAAFQNAAPRLQSDVAVAGYSYGGVLGAPTLTFGQLADVRGLNGEEELKRLALAALDGDAGGPVVDAGGAVLGMLLPKSTGGRALPEGVSFAADAAAVRKVLQQAGISPATTFGGEQVAPEILSKQATGMTVLVSCWD